MKNVLTCRARRRAALLALASASAVAVTLAPAAYAQNAPAEVQFDIPAQSLDGALVEFTRVTGVQLVYPASLAQGLSTTGVRGRMSPDAALATLLSGTGLAFRRMDSGSITIEKLESGGSERVLGAVRVQGSQNPFLTGATALNGSNGSRDVTATEGTGSYTTGAMTIGGKVAASIKDTPQSISILTSQQLKDQNINTFDQVMKQLPGVTSVQGSGGLKSNLSSTFYSRGFEITQIQVDGGAPIQTGEYYLPLIDMSIYDHVEILRGASSFAGFGSPGGVVNLVRKRALDHNQLLIDLQKGSWNTNRISLDATGPLALNGGLRGRAVITYQSNDYFYEVANDRRMVLFLTADLDVTPTTVLSGGINYTWQNSVPNFSGVPRYLTGEDIGLPRSTCFCAPWGRIDFRDQNIFLQLQKKFGSDWDLSIKLNQPFQKADYLYANQASVVEKGVNQLALSASKYGHRNKQDIAEAVLSGKFKFLGQQQRVTIGASFARSNPPHSVEYYFPGYSDNPPVIDIFNFDPYDPTQFPDPVSSSIVSYERFEQADYAKNAYIDFDFSPFKRFHIVGGLRYSSYLHRENIVAYCTPGDVPGWDGTCPTMDTVGEIRGRTKLRVVQSNFAWPPKLLFRYDVKDNLNVYGSYTDIYIRPDTDQRRTLDGLPLPPVRGSNLEGGLKWAFNHDKANFTLSFYRTERTDIPVFAPSVGISCVNPNCYIVGSRGQVSDSSTGVDLELSGEVLPNLQFSGSINYNVNKKQGLESIVGGDRGKPLVSRSPKYMYKAFFRYDMQGAGLRGLAINFGFSGQTSNYVNDVYCRSYVDESGVSQCSYENYDFTQPSRVIFSAGVNYSLSHRYQISLAADNMLDKNYYSTGGSLFNNWYGSPRSVTLSIRGKF